MTWCLRLLGTALLYGGGVLIGISIGAETGFWPHWGIGFILVVISFGFIWMKVPKVKNAKPEEKEKGDCL